ncbi:MAG: hypothetical protein WC708_02245 [Lentisphaeria bacterium]
MDTIVPRREGKRKIPFKPLHLLAGAAALGSGMYTGVVGSLTVFVWIHDRVTPDALLIKSSIVGATVTFGLILLTVFVGKREKGWRITVSETNRHSDPRRLY